MENSVERPTVLTVNGDEAVNGLLEALIAFQEEYAPDLMKPHPGMSLQQILALLRRVPVRVIIGQAGALMDAEVTLDPDWGAEYPGECGAGYKDCSCAGSKHPWVP